MLNGYHIRSMVDKQEAIVLEVASGTLDRAKLENWLNKTFQVISSTRVPRMGG